MKIKNTVDQAKNWLSEKSDTIKLAACGGLMLIFSACSDPAHLPIQDAADNYAIAEKGVTDANALTQQKRIELKSAIQDSISAVKTKEIALTKLQTEQEKLK